MKTQGYRPSGRANRYLYNLIGYMKEQDYKFLFDAKSMAISGELVKGLVMLESFRPGGAPDFSFLVRQLLLCYQHAEQSLAKGNISIARFKMKKDFIKQRLIGAIREWEENDTSATIVLPEAKAPDRLLLEPGQMVEVKGGIYHFGGSLPDNEPGRSIMVESFQIDQYLVTNRQYADFLNQYGQDRVKAGSFEGQPMAFPHKWGMALRGGQWMAAEGYEQHPVVWVTWYGANEYSKYYGLRLPTELEWEYAAVGGKEKPVYAFSGSDELEEVAWQGENAAGATHPVGQKNANGLGLYDMSGNVFEWCANAPGAFFDLQGSSLLRSFKVVRGGAWNSYQDDCLITSRKWFAPGFRFNTIGFRCAGAIH